jgi:hypothetical protein
MWSVQTKGIEGYRVECHKETLTLSNVTFRVYEAGRQRVLATKQKAVHAYVEGTMLRKVESRKEKQISIFETVVRVSYNPYKGGYFFRCDTGERIDVASKVYFTKTSVYAVI